MEPLNSEDINKAAIREPRLSCELVRSLFDYGPLEGILIRIKSSRKDMLGPVRNFRTWVNGEVYFTSRLIWLHQHGKHPTGLIDHIDRNPDNNRIENLRDVTPTQNQYNKVQANIHGYKGVTWRNRKSKPWLAKIRVDGTRINLGSFATKEEAALAYEKAAFRYHGEFAQLGVK